MTTISILNHICDFLVLSKKYVYFLERANFQIQRATLENLHSLQDRLQDADTWRDVLQKKLRESEMRSKNLRDQQRALREHKVKFTGIYRDFVHNLVQKQRD